MTDEFDVLKYTAHDVDRKMIKRAYANWRAAQNPPLPDRCDLEDCQFHTAGMLWKGERLKPIVDHKNGNNTDNSPGNLRYLCPNCDSQLETRGGGNVGRVLKSEGGFGILDKPTGKRHYVMPAESGHYQMNVEDVELEYEAVDTKRDDEG